ncbi:hypothetical protein D9758_011180 [Tetrapyrgos nigripes]|uniref:Transmembrane protein 135 N-terminal domain-containing protein n=1 Tax=Tetrapyrgos nigripes TaxID=182062 RepID=A0A8H5D8E5_9AGAR|nr:hypothetical protein D9758_011180 [Tetrapyrgos nigripes]
MSGPLLSVSVSGDPTPYATPNSGDRSPGGGFYTPITPTSIRRAMTSFENLVALANSQESLRYVLANRTRTLKEARKMVWRDRGEPVVELADLEECVRWALRGGFRAASLAFGIRACFNIVLALLRLRSLPNDQRFAVIRRAIFGLDTWRFAGMLGTFTGLYKFLLNALPLLTTSMPKYADTFDDVDDEEYPGATVDVSIPPTPLDPNAQPIDYLQVPKLNRQRTERLSLSTQAQRVLIRKRTQRWHAAFAGAIAGGLGVLWEKKSRRVTIAQQLFVRGLQGSYNSWSTNRGISIPHGDVLLFSLVCGQIMYAWLLRPDSLPKGYRLWISNAAKVPNAAVNMNHDLARLGTFNMKDVDNILARSDITPYNQTYLSQLKEAGEKHMPFIPEGKLPFLPKYAPCSAVHPMQTSCLEVPVDRFWKVFKWMLPIYGALHIIPPIIFRRHTFMRDPVKNLARSLMGTGRSSAFLGAYVAIYQCMNCFNHQAHDYLTTLTPSSPFYDIVKRIPKSAIDALFISKYTFWIPGFLAGFTLLIEEKRRRGELAMYVLPKGLESAWVIATGKVGQATGVRGIKNGEIWLMAMAMSMVMRTYQNDPQHLSGLVRRILYQFIGPN